MRALQVTSEDGPDSVALADLPEPDGDFVVAVRAAGVTFPDLLMTRGEYQLRQPLPFILGWEAAGEVLRAPAESGFAVGDRVVTLNFGAHAEQVAVTPETTFALADELSFEEGAALPLNYLTALAALDRRGGLRAGETVLVHGAAGGVGTATVQIGKALGAEVIAVVSTEEKAEVARKAGADSTIVGEAFRESLSDSREPDCRPGGGRGALQGEPAVFGAGGAHRRGRLYLGRDPRGQGQPAVAAKRRCPRLLVRRARHRSRGRRQGCRTPDRAGRRRCDQAGGGVRLPARGDAPPPCASSTTVGPWGRSSSGSERRAAPVAGTPTRSSRGAAASSQAARSGRCSRSGSAGGSPDAPARLPRTGRPRSPR